ncbi:hypothetical protein [Shewanella woodyi]|uniref:hypothetical protein n=1 Tax=Shewanella woodyi TaxID=60961 RepID=UPI0037485F90
MSPFYVFSEKAADILTHILKPRGQFLEVKTESKRKSFVGYYPTNPLRNCLDMERSVYEKYGKGLVVRRAVLIEKNITDEYLFSIEEDISTVFVTEKFKNLIEERGLIGFDFSREIELS